jgi:uncharacterized membrane protein
MDELIEYITLALGRIGKITELILNALSLLVLVIGIVLSLRTGLQQRQRSSSHPLHTYFRMVFGGWLVVALELQLGADIAGTIISPTPAHLIELGAIALIRTFLNYFLTRELREQKEITEAQIEKHPK